MLGNYLKTTLRSLQGNGLYTVINVCGLALGLLCFLLITLFVRYELSYDGFFPDAYSINRISPDFRDSAFGQERHPAGNVAAFAPLARSGSVQIGDVCSNYAISRRMRAYRYSMQGHWIQRRSVDRHCWH